MGNAMLVGCDFSRLPSPGISAAFGETCGERLPFYTLESLANLATVLLLLILLSCHSHRSSKAPPPPPPLAFSHKKSEQEKERERGGSFNTSRTLHVVLISPCHGCVCVHMCVCGREAFLAKIREKG
ncbi:hypothetical protein E2320_014881, partial [Naja naja]